MVTELPMLPGKGSGGVVLHEISGVGVLLGSPNLHPVLDQNI